MGISILWNWLNCTPFSNKPVGGTRIVSKMGSLLNSCRSSFNFAPQNLCGVIHALGTEALDRSRLRDVEIPKSIGKWHRGALTYQLFPGCDGSVLKKGKTWTWCGNFQVLRSADLGLKVSRWVESNAHAHPKLLGARAKHSGPRYGIQVSRLFRLKGFKQWPHHILWVHRSIYSAVIHKPLQYGLALPDGMAGQTSHHFFGSIASVILPGRPWRAGEPRTTSQSYLVRGFKWFKYIKTSQLWLGLRSWCLEDKVVPSEGWC